MRERRQILEKMVHDADLKEQEAKAKGLPSPFTDAEKKMI